MGGTLEGGIWSESKELKVDEIARAKDALLVYQEFARYLHTYFPTKLVNERLNGVEVPYLTKLITRYESELRKIVGQQGVDELRSRMETLDEASYDPLHYRASV